MTVTMLDRETEQVVGYVYEPDHIIAGTIEDEFERRAESWEQETEFSSSITDIVTQEDYLRIIAMGSDVVPLILRRLESSRRYWFRALELLTQAQPVPEGDLGDIEAMAARWLGWGRAHGLIA